MSFVHGSSALLRVCLFFLVSGILPTTVALVDLPYTQNPLPMSTNLTKIIDSTRSWGYTEHLSTVGGAFSTSAVVYGLMQQYGGDVMNTHPAFALAGVVVAGVSAAGLVYHAWWQYDYDALALEHKNLKTEYANLQAARGRGL